MDGRLAEGRALGCSEEPGKALFVFPFSLDAYESSHKVLS